MKRIVVKNISKKFKIGFRKHQGFLAFLLFLFSGREPRRTIEVLKNISLEVEAGEIIGITGPNGSGKSTLLRVISGIYSFDEGAIEVNGKIISLINLYVGLKERLTMKENIFLVGSLFGLSREEIKKKFNLIVSFSELENFINTKIYQFSNGMMQRLVFSVAIHCNPDILLLDEVFEVGDEKFKEKSASEIKKIIKNGGSVILVSQDDELIKKNCDRIIIIDEGRVKEVETI